MFYLLDWWIWRGCNWIQFLLKSKCEFYLYYLNPYTGLENGSFIPQLHSLLSCIQCILFASSLGFNPKLWLNYASWFCFSLPKYTEYSETWSMQVCESWERFSPVTAWNLDWKFMQRLRYFWNNLIQSCFKKYLGILSKPWFYFDLRVWSQNPQTTCF